MPILKDIRERLGFTQAELAQQSGLSLRTIQRLESHNTIPKGHTLAVLSQALEMKPSVLQDKFKQVQVSKKSDASSLRLINLSVLCCIGIPFGNLIIPYLVWRKKRSSPFVDEIGRRILNVQIIWWLLLAFFLSISPFISRIFLRNTHIILYVLFTAYLINIAIVCYTAIKLQRNDFDILKLPLRFI